MRFLFLLSFIFFIFYFFIFFISLYFNAEYGQLWLTANNLFVMALTLQGPEAPAGWRVVVVKVLFRKKRLYQMWNLYDLERRRR